MILIDNYDSFTYNIVQYLKELGVNPKVFKNDEISIDELKKMNFSSIIISPGPKNPDESGISMEVIKEFHKTKKILGVCLGHQCIAQFFGAKIVKSKEPVHGKVSKIYFESDSFFDGLEQGFEATRYHSLEVDLKSLPECIVPLAYADAKMQRGEWKTSALKLSTLPEIKDFDHLSQNLTFSQLLLGRVQGRVNSLTVGLFNKKATPLHLYTSCPLFSHSTILMALKHKTYPTYGVQFHPEAILTQGGKQLLKNFIEI